MKKLASLVAVDAANDKNFVKMETFLFQCWNLNHEHQGSVSIANNSSCRMNAHRIDISGLEFKSDWKTLKYYCSESQPRFIPAGHIQHAILS